MNERSSEVFVLARLSFSKGDLYLITTVREFADEADALAWMRQNDAAGGTSGGWPDWTELRVLKQTGSRYTDLAGMPVATILEG